LIVLAIDSDGHDILFNIANGNFILRSVDSIFVFFHVDFNGYVYRKGRVSFSSHTPEHNDCVGRCERKYIYSDYRKNRDAGSVDLTTGEVYDSRGNSVGYVKTGSDFLMSCAAGALLLLLN
jgi:hypothetical protein